MTKKEKVLLREIHSFLDKGYRFAWAYREDFSLIDALTFRSVTTSRKMALKKANDVITQSKKEIKVWDLKQEAQNLIK